MIIIEENTTRTKIFDLLAEHSPLRAFEIFDKITANQKHKITFQGIHKLLKQMAQEKILCKNRQKPHAINPTFIRKIEQKIKKIVRQQ